jgi:hypothetical protein
MKTPDEFNACNTGKNYFGPSSETYMHMRRDAANADFQIAGHEFAVKPNIDTARCFSRVHHVLKRIVIINWIIFGYFIAQFFAGGYHVMGAVRSQRLDKTDLPAFHTCFMQNF